MLSEYDPFSSDTTFLDRVISDLIDETIQARGIVPVQTGNTDDQVIFSTTDYNTIFQGTYSDYSLVQITRGSFLTRSKIFWETRDELRMIIARRSSLDRWLTILWYLPRTISQWQNVILCFWLLITWTNAHLCIKYQTKPIPCHMYYTNTTPTLLFSDVSAFLRILNTGNDYNPQYWLKHLQKVYR